MSIIMEWIKSDEVWKIEDFDSERLTTAQGTVHDLRDKYGLTNRSLEANGMVYIDLQTSITTYQFIDCIEKGWFCLSRC